MPPCHSAAAIGTLPIEHTKLMHGDERPDDHVLDARPEAVTVQEDVVPHVHRAPARPGSPATTYPITQLAPQHREVGHGVAGRVRPRRRDS